MENKKTFGEYIKSKRIEMGLTQKNFANKLFVTESAVSKWERGLSYPDLTLIRSICEVLQISEHELLTASEDIKARNDEKLAKKYMRMIQRFKITQYILYGVPIVVCFICNLAIQHTLSWFFIVLASELVAASLTLLPVFVEKRRGLITLGGFLTSLLILLMVCCIYTGGNWFFIAAVPVLFGMFVVFLPFVLKGIWLPEPFSSHKTLLYFAINSVFLFILLAVCDLYTHGGWFFDIACPIALFSLILPWGIMLIIRYVKINGFFKAAGCFALAAGFFYTMRGFINMIEDGIPFQVGLKFDFHNWSDNVIANNNIDAIIVFSLLGLGILFAVLGIMRELREKHV
jgi:transcriptional regulator with XRE-family HTH domain